MNFQRLTHDELAVAERWLDGPHVDCPEATEILSRALLHLRRLLNQDMSRADLVKYLRIQMGIEPKSEQLGGTPPSNHSPGSAIFRR